MQAQMSQRPMKKQRVTTMHEPQHQSGGCMESNELREFHVADNQAKGLPAIVFVRYESDSKRYQVTEEAKAFLRNLKGC